MFDDPHLNHSGGLLNVTIPGGEATRLPALPIALGDKRPGLMYDIPEAGEDSIDILQQAGFSDSDIDSILKSGVVKTSEEES